MTKEQLKALGHTVGLQYVCIEYSNHWEQDLYVYQCGDYASGFYVYNFLLEDLTEKNMALCVKMGMSRVS